MAGNYWAVSVGVFVLAWLCAGTRGASASEPVACWTTHSLEKLFPDSAKPEGAAASIALKAARNDTEDAQVALRVPKGPGVASASFSLPDLVNGNGDMIAKDQLSASWIWYTYVLNNPPENKDPATYLRKAPAFFPDGFIEQPEIRIRDEWTQPLWVSVHVTKETPPGEYEGTLGIDLIREKDSEKQHIDVPLTVTVWAFTLPEESHLHHTEWFSPESLARFYRFDEWSEAHWTWIERVARDMGRHKQDMIITPFTSLVKVTETAPGKFAFDFALLDRYIETFKEAGVTWIEGGHVAGRCAGWDSQFVWGRFGVMGADGNQLDLSKLSEEQFEPYAEAFLKGIHAHLKGKGWAERYVQHIADEPTPLNMKSWCYRAGQVRKWLPGVPIIDAVMSEGLKGYIDMRVPQIQHLKPDTKRDKKEQMWSYVCLYPQGKYPNRFLDYPLIRNRIIYWLSWSLDLKGFLQWGYCHWFAWDQVPVPVPVSPWLDASGASIYVADRQPLPSGDPFIVYPGKDKICSSMRWEDVRNGFEDFEYLYLLDQLVKDRHAKIPKADRQAAKHLLDRVRTEIAHDPGNHIQDPAALLAIREEIGEMLSKLTARN